jgi:hypothetical protein
MRLATNNSIEAKEEINTKGKKFHEIRGEIERIMDFSF